MQRGSAAAPRNELEWPPPRRRADAALEEIRHALAHVSDPPAPATPRILHALAAHLDSPFAAAYGLDPGGDGIRVEYFHILGEIFSAWPSGFAEALRREPRGFLQYDPFRVDPGQRNRAVVIPQARVERVAETGPAAFRELAARNRLVIACHQLRALVCDGPVLLGWVGAVRESAPYGPHESARLQRLVPTLRERLALEARLGIGAAAAPALAAALERLASPAFIVRSDGALAHANAAGRAARDRALADVADALRRCARGEHVAGWTATRVAAPGLPVHLLAVESRPPADPAPRVAALRARWRLSRRQGAVLLGLSRGESNKGIAAALGCAESTVEAHLTAVYERAGCSGRSALAARVWEER